MDDSDELHVFHSDKFQEYKQKHRELKAAVAKELGFNLLTTEATDGREKNSDQETGCGKEAEDEVNSTTAESLVEGSAVVLVNGSGVEAAEQSQAEGSDRAEPEGNKVNGVQEVRMAGEESPTEASIKTNASEGKAEVNGEVNGALDSPTSPLAHKGKGTWADIVSNATLANGTGDKDKTVKKAGHITANRVAEK